MSWETDFRERGFPGVTSGKESACNARDMLHVVGVVTWVYTN